MPQTKTAVIKAEYVRQDRVRATGGPGASAAGAANYLGRDSEGAQLHQEQHGELPGARLDTGEELDDMREIRHAAAQMAEDHEYRYSFTISPNPEESRDWDREDWDRFTAEMQDRISEMKDGSESLAFQHPDEEHGHIHVQVYCDRTFSKSELNELRESASEVSREISEEREARVSDVGSGQSGRTGPTQEEERDAG